MERCAEANKALHDLDSYEYFGLKETFESHLFPPPSKKQEHPLLDQIAQSLIQPEWVTHILSG